MDTRNHKLGHATCRIAQSNAIPLHMRPRIRELRNVYVPPEHRGKGEATALVNKVCNEADMLDIILILMIEDEPTNPYDETRPMNQIQLASWYANKFGFIITQANPLLMARMPGSTPRFLQLNAVTESIQVIKKASKV